jgi:hypothetical protein
MLLQFLLFDTILIMLRTCHFQVNVLLPHLLKLLLSIAYQQIFFVVLVGAAVIRKLSEVQIDRKHYFLMLALFLLVSFRYARVLFWLRLTQELHFVFWGVVVQTMLDKWLGL